MLKRTSVLRTLTVDNGKEFAGHEAVAAASGAEVYFARPYHSWERGSNENVNGHIRRRYPKGASFREFGEDGGRAIEALEARLNNRPMRCLGWETPAEAMAELVRAETRG
jgi:IS30 family transposase